jgi:diguanylate cyclase (GGDEF)-like protein
VNAAQIGLMLAEIVIVSALFLGCFRMRSFLGLVPVYTMLGGVFYAVNLLAGGVYVEVAPGVVVSPGTVAFFPVILFIVLCVYIIEDTDEARKLIWGLLLTNVFIAALGWLTAEHLRLPGAINAYHLAPDLFAGGPRVSTVSVLAIFADTILIILLYELFSRYTRATFLRVYLSTSVTLAFDTVVFITGAYVENPHYWTILLSAMGGKLLAAILYSVIVAVYLDYFDVIHLVTPGEARPWGRMFRTLTYRQKYELLAAASARDPLTGLFNRGFFDEILKTNAATSLRAETPLAILLGDIDHFKRVNDSHGHVIGDRVLAAAATRLAASFRSSDYVCRYGGEEFAAILPNTDLAAATLLAEKARRRIEDLVTGDDVPIRVTITIGVAAFPDEAPSPQALLELVDRRLYAGKRNGRNQVVAGNVSAATKDPR